jgi:peptidoglycan/LPS O-acetylase OafA/YrhL
MSSSGTSQRLYYPKLDGLRFIAFFLVLVSHIACAQIPVLSRIYWYGWMGVELFFILSSFLLTRLLVEELRRTDTILVGKYFMRRILRIWPLYFFYIILMIVLFGLPSGNYTIARILGLATFTDNLWTSIWGLNVQVTYTAHLWTISLEEQYYLLLPLIVPFLYRRKKSTIGAIGLGIWAFLILTRTISVLLGAAHPFIWVLPIQCDAFLFGTLFGLGFFDGLFKRINSYIKMGIGIVLVIAATYMPNVDVIGYNQIAIYPVLTIGFLLLVDGVLSNKHKWTHYVLGNPVMRYLGKITYGLYVYHFFTSHIVPGFLANLPFLAALSPTASWFVQFFGTLAATIVLAVISYELYERHFLKLKKKRYTIIESRQP